MQQLTDLGVCSCDFWWLQWCDIPADNFKNCVYRHDSKTDADNGNSMEVTLHTGILFVHFEPGVASLTSFERRKT